MRRPRPIADPVEYEQADRGGHVLPLGAVTEIDAVDLIAALRTIGAAPSSSLI
jgi:hypothetical protein